MEINHVPHNMIVIQSKVVINVESMTTEQICVLLQEVCKYSAHFATHEYPVKVRQTNA